MLISIPEVWSRTCMAPSELNEGKKPSPYRYTFVPLSITLAPRHLSFIPPISSHLQHQTRVLARVRAHCFHPPSSSYFPTSYPLPHLCLIPVHTPTDASLGLRSTTTTLMLSPLPLASASFVSNSAALVAATFSPALLLAASAPPVNA